MDKKVYYVSVQSRTIMEQQGEATFEFEIKATPDEIEQLISVFEGIEDADGASYIRGGTPGIPYHHDEVNDDYDYYLEKAYQMIYQFGTATTKKHIQAMGIPVPT
jgi:hypothetical protein